MIDEIDSMVATWLTSVLEPTKVEVAFRAPSEPGNQRRPVVSAALYDIVEEETARSNHVDDIRDDTGRVIARQGAPRRFVLSYQLSIVVADAAIEHQLLGRILQAGVDTDMLPSELLPDDLRAAGLSVPLTIAKPRPANAFGVGMPRVGDPGWRTTLDLTVIVPVIPAPITEIAPPAEKLDLGVSHERGNGAPASVAPGADRGATSANRKWTAVRRRETGPTN